MNSAITKVLAIAAMAVAAVAAADQGRKPYDYKPADLGQVRNGPGDAMIMPATFLREYDPVTILFSRDMNPAGPGPLDRPDAFATIKPAHPGEWRWLDPRTIEFSRRGPRCARQRR